MKAIKIERPKDWPEAHVYPVADLHLGDLNANGEAIAATLGKIQADPYAVVFLLGDICNTATRNSVSDIYSETLSPMEQLKRACDFLAPIADKVGAAVTGNHEERTYKQDGLDITQLVATQLGFGDRYRSDFAYCFLRFGSPIRRRSEGRKMAYSIYCNHGNGGGRKIGGKANRLNDNSLICDADLFLVGHTHTPLIFKDGFIRSEANTGAVYQVERLYVNTTAYLDYGGYGARQGYQPSAIAQPVIILDGERRGLSVSL